MPTIDPQRSLLLVIDIQTRLMPAIHDGESVIRNAGRLIEATKLIGVPRLFTEQNPKGLGPTVDAIAVEPGRLVEKQSFDVCREAGFLDRIPADAHVVVAGCEAHVCVLQTVLGLRAAGRDVYVAADAIGSRAPANREAALRRMERHGAEAVTTEMVVFEWLQTALHPQFRSAAALIK
ncbi:MAG TPA: isochorismatase family protein [Aquamicrobium sp.]|nr:isochorismatase family protein [Aquamicrobium sp.]